MSKKESVWLFNQFI